MNILKKIFGEKRTQKKNKKYESYVKIFFEFAYLSKVKRNPLKTNPLSIADHSFRVTMIANVLAEMHDKESIDQLRVLQMALLHDFPETRIGDLDLINRIYNSFDEKHVLQSQTKNLPFSSEWLSLFSEYKKKETREARIVHDADVLDEMLTEKQQLDRGNKKANDWLQFSLASLKTPVGKELGQAIVSIDSDQWWYDLIDENYTHKE